MKPLDKSMKTAWQVHNPPSPALPRTPPPLAGEGLVKVSVPPAWLQRYSPPPQAGEGLVKVSALPAWLRRYSPPPQAGEGPGERGRIRRLASVVLAVSMMCIVPASVQAAEKPVNLTHSVKSVEVVHLGKKVRIERNPDTENMLDPDFSLTSRPCPPYCIQPMTLAPGVETIGELELIEYLKKAGKETNLLVIDSRDGDWPQRSGVIPGAISMPWQELHPGQTDAEKIVETLQLRFGATRLGSLWNFENAKTLVFYCNGPWCGQSPTNIKQLLAMGYPAHKLKWYRGGMQDWKMLGLTTVVPK